MPASIVRLHSQKRLQLVVSRRVLVELVRASETKLSAGLPALSRFLLDAPPEVIPDPTAEEVSAAARQINAEDAPIWAAAVTSGAEYFVTGDRSLLREARAARADIITLTPRDLLDVLPPVADP